jgi:hypothetical protein
MLSLKVDGIGQESTTKGRRKQPKPCNDAEIVAKGYTAVWFTRQASKRYGLGREAAAAEV